MACRGNTGRTVTFDVDFRDEALVPYMVWPPVSLARLKLLPGSDALLHFPKGRGDDPGSHNARFASDPTFGYRYDYWLPVLLERPDPTKPRPPGWTGKDPLPQ